VPKNHHKARGFHGVNAIVPVQLKQANNALVNFVSAAAANRDQIVLLNQTIHTQNEAIAALTKQYQTLGNKMDAFNLTAPTTDLPVSAPSNRVPMLDDSKGLPNGHHKSGRRDTLCDQITPVSDVGMSSNPWLSVLREYSFLDCVLNLKSTD
jgi:hypothetical protein